MAAALKLDERLFIIATHFLIEIAFYTMLALATSRQAVSNAYLSAKPLINRAAGAGCA